MDHTAAGFVASKVKPHSAKSSTSPADGSNGWPADRVNELCVVGLVVEGRHGQVQAEAPKSAWPVWLGCCRNGTVGATKSKPSMPALSQALDQLTRDSVDQKQAADGRTQHSAGTAGRQPPCWSSPCRSGSSPSRPRLAWSPGSQWTRVTAIDLCTRQPARSSRSHRNAAAGPAQWLGSTTRSTR